MRLGGVGADVHRALAVLHVVVRIGHRTVAPGVRHASHRGGMADARLVVAVVGAPEAHELAQQIGLFVVVLGRADEVDRVRAAGFLQRLHPGGDFFQRGVPADALVLAVHQLHRVAKTVFAVTVLTQRGALGAMGTQVDRRVEHRLLAHPDAVLDDGVGGATHRAVGADGALDFDLAGAVDRAARGRLRFLDQGQLRGGQANADAQSGTAQESAPVHGGEGRLQAALQAVNESVTAASGGAARGLFGEHHRGAPRVQIRVVL